jgi:hypothetical protein
MVEERSASDAEQRGDLAHRAADAGGAAGDLAVYQLARRTTFAWLGGSWRRPTYDRGMPSPSAAWL